MIELLKTMPFDRITVTKLCQQSNVSRPTFYHHFNSLSHLAFDAILYSVKNTMPGLESWEDYLENIKPIMISVRENIPFVYSLADNEILRNESFAALYRILNKAIRRQETLLNYRLSPANRDFVIRLCSETYIAFFREYGGHEMNMDLDIIATQCKAILGEAIPNALRGFMRLDQ